MSKARPNAQTDGQRSSPMATDARTDTQSRTHILTLALIVRDKVECSSNDDYVTPSAPAAGFAPSLLFCRSRSNYCHRHKHTHRHEQAAANCIVSERQRMRNTERERQPGRRRGERLTLDTKPPSFAQLAGECFPPPFAPPSLSLSLSLTFFSFVFVCPKSIQLTHKSISL